MVISYNGDFNVTIIVILVYGSGLHVFPNNYKTEITRRNSILASTIETGSSTDRRQRRCARNVGAGIRRKFGARKL